MLFRSAIEEVGGRAVAIQADLLERGRERSAFCAACHGAGGESTRADYPDLAGQSIEYLVVQFGQFTAKDIKFVTPHLITCRTPRGDVGTVDVIEGVEAVFHPAEGKGFLFVSVNGWINMVIG